MKILKALALSFLSLLLFISLSALGLAFMLNRTVLNPNFVNSEIKSLDISSLVREELNKNSGGIPDDVRTSIVNAVPQIEPMLKEQISAGIYPLYDYLLGKDKSLDLATIMRNSVLKTDFLVSSVDKIDLSPFAKEYLRGLPTQTVPAVVLPYLLDSMDKTMIDLKPWIKQQVATAADPVLNYLLGKTQGFNIVIPLDPVKEAFRANVREAFLKSPPPEVAGMSSATLGAFFDMFYQQFSATLPSTYTLNESFLPSDIRVNITNGLTEAEINLQQVKRVVGYAQLTFLILIGLVLLLLLCIVLIYRDVKGATRSLGTTFLVYGALEYAGVLVTKYFIGKGPVLSQVPISLQTWLPQFVANFLTPLAIFSLDFAIAGVILIIISFVYKPRQA